MKQKAFVLQNKGMNRDLSVSKAGESSAYENHNVRILARDHDTMLSVTNERGNRVVVVEGLSSDGIRVTEDEEIRFTEDELLRSTGEGISGIPEFHGILIGWNVLNNQVVLFTNEGTTDRIYRVDYEDDRFFGTLLFEGSLGFDVNFPIESVVYHETDEIQKIYWVDGKNVLRFMNFAAKPDETTGLLPWQISATEYDETYFDSNRKAEFGVSVEITKDNSGNTRANGVVQYLLTYYNKHGQETGYIWISDLVYLSPLNSGGSADGTNMNAVKLSVSGLDDRFTHFRIYSVFRSALNGTVVAYMVHEGLTSDGSAVVVDDGANLVAEDASRLLYLGSQPVRAGTLTHKDQTLFLGDLQSIGKTSYDELERTIKANMFSTTEPGKSVCVEFVYSGDDDSIDYKESETYVYESQLGSSSSEITGFKGGEKYRFALCFRREDGSMTEAFWIGDAVNEKYPVIDGGKIRRVIARCTLPGPVVSVMKDLGFAAANLMIAEATYADRSVKAQGILNPTMFNVWDRFKDRLYSSASWITRLRQSDYAWKHFDVVRKSVYSTGEIQCNYWTSEIDPVPYYRMTDYGTSDATYTESFDSGYDADYLFVVYGIQCSGLVNHYSGTCYVISAKMRSFAQSAMTALNDVDFTSDLFTNAYEELGLKIVASQMLPYETNCSVTVEHPSGMFDITISTPGREFGRGTGNPSIDVMWNGISKYLVDNEVPSNYIIPRDSQILEDWCDVADQDEGKLHFFRFETGSSQHSDSALSAFNFKLGDSDRWMPVADFDVSSSVDYAPSYYKKHLMFVDENVITLNSPEFDYEALLLDGAEKYKMRIVGVAVVTDNIADYVVDAEPGKLAGENLISTKFSSLNGLLSCPLWREYGYIERVKNDKDETYEHSTDNVKDWTSVDYVRDGSIRRYWLHMWQSLGSITNFSEYKYDENGSLVEETGSYSKLRSKTFANLKYSPVTMYNNLDNPSYASEYDLDSLRMYNYTSSQYVRIDVGDEAKTYDGVVEESLSMPGKHKYPVLYSSGVSSAEDEDVIRANDESFGMLFSNVPVQITYASSPHVVMTLHTDPTSGYVQTILPKFYGHSGEDVNIPSGLGNTTGSILPWSKKDGLSGASDDYAVSQGTFRLSNDPLTGTVRTVSDSDRYLYIGEIYYDFGDNDTRYGGITDSAVQNNRFMLAGPQAVISDMAGDGRDVLVADQGDTYFQRWDCMKTKPYSTGALNNVIDVTSVMIESHVNMDGRTDLQRGGGRIASMNVEKFGQLNPVYSQHNNFFVQHDLDEDFNLDAYRSSITWTLEKHDSEDVDAWTHVTLANTLKLDGDKGVCQALRRLQNSIIAFQDRGISEILFNSRTQLSTQDGVPVEIANSGKVDGKRYITNKYGCTNKWSIVEGKAALYFVDNVNKAFCAFNGQSIDNLSTRLGFGAWFRETNGTEPWKPANFDNLVAYYDKVHADVYLVRNTDDEMPCLVYNENLGAFSSFFDYRAVLMMTNVEDRFLSYRNHHLWLQNEGPYCSFFGTQHDYWVQYRVTPDPYLDKIWTNVDYRADVYEVLDEEGTASVPEEYLVNGDVYGSLDDTYKEYETFTNYKVWDEYQTTGVVPLDGKASEIDPVRKKFRIWRLTIPRAKDKTTGKATLDRIRNPWINVQFKKENPDGKNLMQMHDFIIKYFE